jgi:HAMP domain-containing protein
MAAKKKNNSPDPKSGPAKNRRLKLTLGGVFTSLIILSTLTMGGVSGYFSFTALRQEKLRDTWAIQFLELEQRGHKLTQYLQSIDSDIDAGRKPDVILHVDSNSDFTKLTGDFPDKIKAADLHLENSELYTRWNIIGLSGINYLARQTTGEKAVDWVGATAHGVYLLLWKMDVPDNFIDPVGPLQETTGYLVTKEGRLLYTNDSSITEVNFGTRPLVQRFIQAPLGKGQLQFVQHDREAYGFFYEIPETNLLLFGETPKSAVLGELNSVAIKFILVLVATLLGVIVILNYPVNSLSSSVSELARLCRQIGAGNFHVQPSGVGFGEVGMLTKNFNEMAKSLAKLYPDETDKAAKETELVPESELLPPFHSTDLPEESGIEVAQFSVRTKPTGADWQTVWFDASRRQTTLCLADVNGREYGAAMVVGIIAGEFENARSNDKGEGFSIHQFAERVNTVLVQAHLKWLARVLVARIDAESQEAEILNMGSPYPLLFNPWLDKFQTEVIELPSQPAGTSAGLEASSKRISFPTGSFLTFFTNGATKLVPQLDSRTLENLPVFTTPISGQTPTELAIQWKKAFDETIKGKNPPDDICFFAVRAK